MRHGFTLIPLLILALAGIAAAEDLSGAGPVKITADSLSHDRATSTYLAEGNVRIDWEDATLTADRASVDQQKNQALAEGGVTLVKEGDVLRSDRLAIDIVTGEGEVINGDLFVPRNNFHLRAGRLARTGPEDYRMESGSFTTCDGDDPSWSFSAKRLDVTLEEYATARDAIFYIKDFPVFYFPYLIFPVKTERQSGFLFPRIGSSTKKGFYLDLPYYWAISPSQDVTFNLDLQTRRGVGTGADYRYIRRQGSDGQARGYGIYDTDRSRFRGDLEAKHREFFSDTLYAKGDIAVVTDRDFYRDFSTDTGIYNRQLLDSSVSLTKTWENSVLAGEVRYVQDLEAPNNRLTLQRLPSITYTLLERQLPVLPLSFGLDASFVNFYREEGGQGRRIDLHPVLSHRAPIPGGALMLWGGYRQRLYDSSSEGDAGFRSSGIADAGAVATTTLERVYEPRWGAVERVRHTLIPELGYRFVDSKNQEGLPFFDFNDRVVGQSMATWGISNFFTGRIGGGDLPEYRELAYLRLSQGYELSGSRRDLLTLTDPARPWTDIRIESRFTPVKQLSLSADSRFDPYRLSFSTAAVAGEVNDGEGNMAGIGYRTARGVVEYLEGRLGVALVKPLLFNYTGRYSFDRAGFLESLYTVEFKRQCWSLTFSFRDRPDNREFLVGFTLSGIGAVGPVKAF
ncbi:LPS-assembly protein LptD [Geobacter sp. DSM 9736]|uniref:LPS-assembly protein LptD n=1 Tax=Geobacter sp. DSM 9736 TaxID=1277350 RepID=UPI000B617B28|nr:LPS assembly protein LptD [Geobacter sp. DSM 9736]SNB44661.1 LPS-assembly protein [Geobacter sp. DSM 9736]